VNKIYTYDGEFMIFNVGDKSITTTKSLLKDINTNLKIVTVFILDRQVSLEIWEELLYSIYCRKWDKADVCVTSKPRFCVESKEVVAYSRIFTMPNYRFNVIHNHKCRLVVYCIHNVD